MSSSGRPANEPVIMTVKAADAVLKAAAVGQLAKIK